MNFFIPLSKKMNSGNLLLPTDDKVIFDNFTKNIDELYIKKEIANLYKLLPTKYKNKKLLNEISANKLFTIEDIQNYFTKLKNQILKNQNISIYNSDFDSDFSEYSSNDYDEYEFSFQPLFAKEFLLKIFCKEKDIKFIEKFIEKLSNEFLQNDIDKEEFIKILPEYMATKSKKKVLNSFTRLTLNNIMYFLKHKSVQTGGRDFRFYDLFIIYYKLELDSIHRIIFTKEFPFDSNIKKQAYLTWWDNQILINHPFISRYPSYLNFTTEYHIERILFKYRNLRVDIFRAELREALEIDEIDKSDDERSKQQDALCNLIGIYTNRLEFWKIHSGEIYRNINVTYKTSSYSQEYYNKRIYLATCSLMRIPKVLDEYMWDLFRKDIYLEIENIYSQMHEINTLSDIDGNKHKLLESEFNKKQNLIDSNNKILETLVNDPIIYLMKECKKKSLNLSKDFILGDFTKINKKNISFETILEISNIESTDVKKVCSIKECLSEIGIITSSLTNEKEINISWSELNDFIIKIKNIIKDDFKDILLKNYKNLDKNYQICIMMLKHHYESTISSSVNLKIYIDRYKKILTKQVKKESEIEYKIKYENIISDMEYLEYQCKNLFKPLKPSEVRPENPNILQNFLLKFKNNTLEFAPKMKAIETEIESIEAAEVVEVVESIEADEIVKNDNANSSESEEEMP